MAPMPDSYVEYPNRRAGMDHDRYDYRPVPGRRPLAWPQGTGLAVVPIVPLESFRLDDRGATLQPIASPMVEYPDFWGYTRLEYGNRAGVERVVSALEGAGVIAAAAADAEVCERYPKVLEEVGARGWEVVGHGLSGSVIVHEEVGEGEEAELLDAGLEAVRRVSGQQVRGWLSPGLSESSRTLDLLAARGVDYVLDWVNDEVPYEIRTTAGAVHSVPFSYELSDLHMIGEQGQTSWDYVDQVLEAARVLQGEAAAGGARVLSLAFHPWIMGVPHRAGHLEALLAGLCELDGVWWTTPGAVAEAYRQAAAGD